MGILLENSRLEDESHQEYRKRRSYNNELLKQYLQGKWINQSKHLLQNKGITYLKDQNNDKQEIS